VLQQPRLRGNIGMFNKQTTPTKDKDDPMRPPGTISLVPCQQIVVRMNRLFPIELDSQY